MYRLQAYLNLANGDKQTTLIQIDQKQYGDVIAVSIEGIVEGFHETLDANLGVCIEIHTDTIKEWMSDFKYCEFWCMPDFGTEISKIPDDTQGLIYRKENGQYGVILPVVSKEYKCVLCGAENRSIVAKLFSNCDGLNRISALAFLYAEGENPYELLRQCAKVGTVLLQNGVKIREERRYPEVFEYLGWCSWDAFQIRVNEQGLISKCEEFKQKNIPVKWAMLDDMWAEVRDFYKIEYSEQEEMFELMHGAKLYSFEADPNRFPNGLQHCIQKIKDYNIKVGMWHPTTGYWRGVDPEGPLFRTYKDLLVKTPNGMYVHSYELDKAYRYYDTIHDYFRKCGAEFVKIDNQSRMANCYKGMAPIGITARSYHKAMEASVGEHFDNCMINCMGMANEDMWNRSQSAISRCSDDFKPENRDWFAKHITQCAFNSLIQGQFYYCDWDMWWTDDSQAEKNSLLRAISGGPVYVSDQLNRSRAEILKPLIFDDGKILRCDKPAMPTKDCLTQNPVTSGKIFKLQNTCGNSGVVAIFNLDELNRPVDGTVSPMDVEGLLGDEFAVYEHFSKELKICSKDQSFDVSLHNVDDFKLYIIVPIVDGFAPIGRIDKYISPASIRAVNGNKIELVEKGDYAYVENGKLVIETVK